MTYEDLEKELVMTNNQFLAIKEDLENNFFFLEEALAEKRTADMLLEQTNTNLLFLKHHTGVVMLSEYSFLKYKMQEYSENSLKYSNKIKVLQDFIKDNENWAQVIETALQRLQKMVDNFSNVYKFKKRNQTDS